GYIDDVSVEGAVPEPASVTLQAPVVPSPSGAPAPDEGLQLPVGRPAELDLAGRGSEDRRPLAFRSLPGVIDRGTEAVRKACVVEIDERASHSKRCLESRELGPIVRGGGEPHHGNAHR